MSYFNAIIFFFFALMSIHFVLTFFCVGPPRQERSFAPIHIYRKFSIPRLLTSVRILNGSSSSRSSSARETACPDMSSFGWRQPVIRPVYALASPPPCSIVCSWSRFSYLHYGRKSLLSSFLEGFSSCSKFHNTTVWYLFIYFFGSNRKRTKSKRKNKCSDNFVQHCITLQIKANKE